MSSTNSSERLRSLRDSLLVGLIERDTAIRLALLAALAGEHLLLIGPPGTAKSELARRLRHAFHDATYFERLLTRFSTPEELFGPLSIKALEEDRYERKTEHYLPAASVAFLDEIFKANSAILNALLTLLNEREFDNGSERKKTPLISVVAASNELPDGDELHALYDRFLLRYQVTPVSENGFVPLLDLRAASGFQAPGEALKLRREEVMEIQKQAEDVTLPDEVKALLIEFRKFLAGQKIVVSDRRWRKIVRLLQISAFTNGRQEISIWDCWLLQHCVWEKPEQITEAREWYEKRLGTASKLNPERLVKLANALEKALNDENLAKEQRLNEEGEPLFEDDGQFVTSEEGKAQKSRKGKPLFLAPAETGQDRSNKGQGFTQEELRESFPESFQHHHYSYRQFDSNKLNSYTSNAANFLTASHTMRPALEPKRYSRHHIEGRCNEAKKHLEQVQSHIAGLERHIASLVSTVESHLWIQPGFSTVAKRSLEDSKAEAKRLEIRMLAVHDGFSKLPVLIEQTSE
ncbi:MAG: AAA family ATPase [Limisphaerales bacterium]